MCSCSQRLGLQHNQKARLDRRLDRKRHHNYRYVAQGIGPQAMGLGGNAGATGPDVGSSRAAYRQCCTMQDTRTHMCAWPSIHVHETLVTSRNTSSGSARSAAQCPLGCLRLECGSATPPQPQHSSTSVCPPHASIHASGLCRCACNPSPSTPIVDRLRWGASRAQADHGMDTKEASGPVKGSMYATRGQPCRQRDVDYQGAGQLHCQMDAKYQGAGPVALSEGRRQPGIWASCPASWAQPPLRHQLSTRDGAPTK